MTQPVVFDTLATKNREKTHYITTNNREKYKENKWKYKGEHTKMYGEYTKMYGENTSNTC